MLTSVELVADGWALTQSGLLTTSKFIASARERGFQLAVGDLESLCRQRLLVPLLAVHDEPQSSPVAHTPGPRRSHTRSEIDSAAAEGRLSDPGSSGLPTGWRFARRDGDSPEWWNGLVYSRWQLLVFAYLTESFTMGGHPLVQDGSGWPEPDWAEPTAQVLRDLAMLLCGIEARYLPIADEDWIRPRGAEREEWESYRDSFDPSATAARFGVDGSAVLRHADRLLSRAGWIDPLGPWSRVVRHAKPKQQERLKGLARLSLDLRLAAEVLLLFADDLGEPDQATDRIVVGDLDDRLGRHGESLDTALQSVGVSPHPRVALLVEGETEVLVAEKILEHRGLGARPDGLRIINMRGVTDQERVRKLAAHLAIPIVVAAYPDRYRTLRPLCRIIVATDPEGPMENPESLRRKLLGDILKGLADQGVKDIDESGIAWLIEVRTWSEPFEYEHFTDTEIADALLNVARHGLPADEAPEAFVARARANRWNLQKSVRGLSKTALAEQLWPVLQARIDESRRQGTKPPPIASVVMHAYSEAVNAMEVNWVIGPTVKSTRPPRPTNSAQH